MKPPGVGFFNDAYLVYELMDTDLHQVIRSSQPLSGALRSSSVCFIARSRLLSSPQTTISSTFCTRRVRACVRFRTRRLRRARALPFPSCCAV